MDDKVKFEEYGIEISDEELKGVSKETLELCKAKIDDAIKELEKKKGENK